MDLTNIKIFLLCHYSLAKYCLKKILPSIFKNEKPPIVTKPLIILLTILILNICIPLLLLFGIYKLIVKTILKFHLKSNFIGFITGCDLLSSFNEKDGIILSKVFFIDSKKSGQELFEEISKKIWDEFTDSSMDKKLVSIRQSFMGYLYFKVVDDLKKEGVLNCIHLDKAWMCEEELNEFLNYHCFVKPLPLNGSFNWDFSLVATPLKKSDGEIRYLMIIRVHHFVVDGITMYNLIKRICKSNKDEVYGETISTKLKTTKEKRALSSNLKSLSMYNKPVSIIDESFLRCNGKSKSYLSILIEPTKNYVLKLKHIKRKINEASFNALLLTAYSASLAQYFKEHSSKNTKIPTRLEVAAPFQMNTNRFSQYYGNGKNTKFKNDFTFLTFDVPIIPEDKTNTPIEDYMEERLNMIVQSFKDYSKTIDYIFNYTFTKTYFEVVTTKIATAFLKYSKYNIMMSILPGGPKLTLFQGDEISNTLLMAPLKPHKTDINFITFSYNDKFHFIQIFDESKFESVGKMDEVLKGLLKYIDVLYEQIVKSQ